MNDNPSNLVLINPQDNTASKATGYNGNIVLVNSNMDNTPHPDETGTMNNDNDLPAVHGQNMVKEGASITPQDNLVLQNADTSLNDPAETHPQVPSIQISNAADDKHDHNSSVDSTDPLLTGQAVASPASPSARLDTSTVPLLEASPGGGGGTTLGDEVDEGHSKPSGMRARRTKTKRPGMFARDRLTMKASPNKDKIINEEDIVIHPAPVAEGNEDGEEDEPAYGYGDMTPEERDRTVAWFEAVEGSDEKAMKWLLESGFDPNRHNQNGWAAIHIACFEGQTELVEILLEAGTDIDLENVHGQTALHLTVKSGHLDIINLLLQANCNINASMASGTTALHYSCQNGDYHTTKKLLEKGANTEAPRTSEGCEGITPLHDACTVGDLDTVEILLDNNANIEAEMGNFFTVLHKASKAGHDKIVAELLARGADPHKVGVDVRGGNVQAVHLAAEYNNPEALKVLLNGGADVNAGRIYHSREGVTSLHVATIREHVDVVKVCLASPACDVDARDEDGVAAIHHAARNGFKEIMQMLIKANCDVDAGACSAQSGNQTALHFAVRYKHMAITKILIAAGAKVAMAEQMRYETNKGDDDDEDAEKVEATLDGYTALHWAAENGDLPMVRLLIDHKCPINAPASFETNHGVTPLHLASQDGHTEIVDELLKYEHCYRDPLKSTNDRSDITPLHQACYNCHPDTVEALLKGGANVNRITDNGYTPLHYAAQQGNTAVAKVVSEAGSDINATARLKNQSNITALHLAVQSGSFPMIKFLVDSGADISIGKVMGDISNITPLHHAVHKQNKEAVDILLGKGCEVNAVTNAGHAPLHMSCERGGKEIAEMLVKAKANVNQAYTYRENIEVSPLHTAAQYGYAEIIKILVPAGAELNAIRQYEDRHSMTPLHQAAENGHLDAVKALLDFGADQDAQDSLGFTPLHLSVQYGFYAVSQALIKASCSIKKETISGLTPVMLAEQLEDHAAVMILKDAKKDRKQSMRKSFINRPKVNVKKKEKSSGGGLRSLLCGFNKNH